MTTTKTKTKTTDQIMALRAAHRFLGTFKVGDTVTVHLDSGDKQMTVARSLERSDFAFSGNDIVPAGSWEGARMTVTFGPGRYSTEISPHSQAKKSGMPYIVEEAT